MQQLNRNLGLLLLGATFMASAMVPAGLRANSAEGQSRPSDVKQKQVYDKGHKDYHTWDSNEDTTYRAWLDSRHEKYRDFSKVNSKEQAQYWDYRHK